VLALLLVCGISAAGSGFGQSAKGNGTKHDANQQRGSGGVNQRARADFAAESALRNAIVTGNAPNALSFRGDVGYQATREFRGDLGSDDLFEFRRDSLFSGISGLGVRGTDALQYQFALTTGQSPPRTLAGSLGLARDSFVPEVPAVPNAAALDTGAGAGRVGVSPGVTRVDPTEFIDTRGVGLTRLRSPSLFLTDRSLAESLIGNVTTSDGRRIGVVASPLTGVRAVVIQDPALQPPAVSPQSALLRDPAAARTDLSLPSGLPTGLDTSTSAADLVGYDRLLSGVRDSYARTLGREGEAQTPDRAEELRLRIEEQNRKLREFIDSLREPPPELPSATPAEPGASGADGDENPDANASDQVLRTLEAMGVDTALLEALRQSNERIERVVIDADAAEADLYSNHMSEGRRLLTQGDYFSAEARFSLALSVTPGDPTASIARVHAQLGAGLFASAGVNLRETLTTHPILLAAGYAPDLLPGTDRLRAVAGRLTELSRGPGAEARNAALLLAYTGRHLGDRALIERGLDRLDVEGVDRLSQLMRLVWLEQRPITEAVESVKPQEPAGP
jgi:hypothetical protein